MKTSTKRKLPVLVLSGFLGSGKTTLINNLLTNNKNIKFALIVNDIGEVNIDAELIRQKGLTITQTTENLVEISNGCICCTLRDDLLIEVKKLVSKNLYDYLIIESSGISEPIPVAQTFTFDDGSKNCLPKITKLDCMLTTVDCTSFSNIMKEGKTLINVNLELDNQDTRSLAGLLIEQIEFANILILTKTDLVSRESIKKTKSILNSLNPYATIIESINGQIDYSQILDTNSFDFEKAQSQAGWIKELQKPTHNPESDEYGIKSYVYKARKPFDKEKFYKSIVLFFDVIRAKGFYWLKEDNSTVFEISQSGINQEYHTTAGYWWASIKKNEWPKDINYQTRILENFEEPYDKIGDRRQEIVFIGQNLNIAKIKNILDECLVDI
jgi:G3E family GTPase